jgi:hypothetical protein
VNEFPYFQSARASIKGLINKIVLNTICFKSLLLTQQISILFDFITSDHFAIQKAFFDKKQEL